MGKALFFPVFLVLTFGPPFYWGITHASVVAPILWAICCSVFVVAGGWRSNEGAGAIKSGVVGLLCALVGFLPIFYIGRLVH